MSRGIGARAELISQNENTVIYKYGGYNLNEEQYRNESHIIDGLITINGLKKTTQIQVTKDAAEDGEEEFKPSGDPEQNGKDSNKKNPNVKTGDNSPLLPLVILIIISGAIIGCMIYRKRKTNIN